MHVLVTGAAGFIGSHVVDRLLAEGHVVTGVDDFDPYYARAIKQANMAGFLDHERLRFLELDLASADLSAAIQGIDAVVHLAATAGVRGSWGDSFETYIEANVLATQRLLEAARSRPLQVFLYASSASVYGNEALEAVSEERLPAPHSPYGVTKLAGEHLAHLYRRVHGVPTVALRLFSCYGPRERPDKAIETFLTAARDGHPISIYGDGSQRRDFSYVGDIVQGIRAALERQPVGEILNLARGQTHSLRRVVQTIEKVTGVSLEASYLPAEAGDVRVTHACIEKARRLLGFEPRVSLEEGIARQWAEVRARRTLTGARPPA